MSNFFIKKNTRNSRFARHLFSVLSKLVKKFNEQYGNGLLEEQKELLSKYIASFHDNAIELKIFLNEEISNLRKALIVANEKATEENNAALCSKITEVINVVDESSKSEITIETITKILKIQSLVKELEINGN